MKTILLTNDDGIYSEGLLVLWRYLKKRYNVCVVVPETEKSAVAHAINLFIPLKIKKISVKRGLDGWLVNGTPVDCVKIGVSAILKKRPDIVVSGINPQSNMGMDILYSGTVSAAEEGALLGIPSFAVSLDSNKRYYFDTAAEITLRIIKKMEGIKIPPDIVININVPDMPISKVKGIRLTYQSKARYEEEYEKRTDPRGNSYYWLKGVFKKVNNEKGSDVDAVKQGYISITPLHLDLTSYSLLSYLQKKIT
ncbi:MAG: 5'/3'-nucleotidase SurE [Candidatus Ratteibacteria bacterium]|nr:5'/3'-nucleotidase SurE [Candidatus Ratteibacteria bacterium]